MAIKRAKPANLDTAATKALDSLIDQAPDGKKVKGVMQGKRRQISIAFPPEWIDRMDEQCKAMNKSRPDFIMMACDYMMENGITITVGGKGKA